MYVLRSRLTAYSVAPTTSGVRSPISELPTRFGTECRMWTPMNTPISGMMMASVEAITYVRYSASPKRRKTTVFSGNSPTARNMMSAQWNTGGKTIVASRPSSAVRTLYPSVRGRMRCSTSLSCRW